ncbi:ogr/Delta-like zinc finger family protein [Serratia liquefaciens]|uniref:ogr/Delta-like zinc finger family protein n=1 Tax=Serratia liquefaciens TaxID=614 RepID=UPI0021787FE8|nr:ogr/Delta-like zinc finger family protein [Serratia liquefaciens]CAI0929475.1 DNA-binding transcriptional regulator [Serratia liquefaciens]
MIPMFPCPTCAIKVKARSSRMLSAQVKEKYYRCNNVACLCTFKTYESFEAFITKTRDPYAPQQAVSQDPEHPQQPKHNPRFSMRLE